MRQIMKLFITSFLFILFSGCTKDVYDPSDKIPGEGTNPFSKVTISSNFDWSMIQISHLTVQSFDPYDGTYNYGSPDKPGGLSIQLCKSEKKEFYIRYSS